MTRSIPDDIFKAETPNQIAGNGAARRIMILTADGTEDTEFFYPYYRLIEEGCTVDVVTPKGGAFKGKNGSGLQNTLSLHDVTDTSDYSLLYIPGGKAPAALKKEDRASAIVRAFVAAGKPVAAICHGPQLLAEARVIKDCTISGWPEIEDEITQAEARFVSEPAVSDRQFVTGRWPGDLPEFTHALMTMIGLQASEQNTDNNVTQTALARKNIAAA